MAALFLYLMVGFNGPLGRDLGLYWYSGQQFADGVLPYAGVLNRAGPFAHAVPGVGVWVGNLLGLDSLFAVRFLHMLISLACLAAVYYVARDVFGSRIAGVGASFALLSFEGFDTYAVWGPREKTAMILAALLVLAALVRRSWWLAGFWIALGTLTWQPMFFGTMLASVVAVLLSVRGARGRLKALTHIAVGGAVPTALLVSVYAVTGNLKLFLDCFVLINARYTEQTSLFDNIQARWSTLASGYGWSLVVFAVGTVALIGLGSRAAWQLRLRRGGDLDARLVAVVVAAVMTLGNIAWSMKAFQSWPDLFVLLPTAAIGCGGLLQILAARTGRGQGLVAGVGALSLLAFVLPWAVQHRGDERVLEQRALVDAVFDRLPATATAVSIGAPQALALAGVRNPTRIQMFGDGFADYVDDTFPGGLEGYGRRVGALRPTVIVVAFKKSLDTWLAPTLEEYRRVGSVGRTKWYIRRSVPAAVRADIRGALVELKKEQKRGPWAETSTERGSYERAGA